MMDYISTSESGKLLGLTRHRVVQMLKEGKLEGFKLERQWVVNRSSVERLKKRREARAVK